jgi:hypothetical protein
VLWLRPDDQHVKIKTVIGIDDHSDGGHASAVEIQDDPRPASAAELVLLWLT